MENLTHSLIGAALAEAALPKDAAQAQRTLFFVSGVLAANLPDADLVYTSITPSPLGYLLHHRGHTHTVPGLIALAVLFGIVSLFPSIRRNLESVEPRYWMLVVAALASHLIADSWNSYGVHPFWPLTNRWFYGDAINIFEPWLWMLLGVSVAMNTRSKRGRRVLSGLLIALPIVAAIVGMIAPAAVAAIAVVAAALIYALRDRTPSARAWTSLSTAALFVSLSFALGAGMRRTSTQMLAKQDSRIVDVVLTPRAGNPLCWSGLALQATGDALEFRRADRGVGLCGAKTAWTSAGTQSISALRQAMNESCSVRAWLQFGRAPSIDGDWIGDERFGDAGRGNFSAMRIASDRHADACPPHLTNWDLPRADILLGNAATTFTPR